MATVYNKTSLKKVKKDELIQMFLDQQAKLNDIELDAEENNKLEKVFNPKTASEYRVLFNRLGISSDGIRGLRAHLHKYEEYKKSLPEYSKLKEENEKLKTDIDYLKHQKSIQRDKLKEFMDEINKLKEENVILDSLSEKLINENEDFKEENVILNSLNEKHNRLYEILKEGNKKLKEENEKVKLENKKLYQFISYYDLPKPEH